MDTTPASEPHARAGAAARIVAGVADVAVTLFAPTDSSTPTLDLALGALSLGARRVDAIIDSTASRLHAIGEVAAATPIVGQVVTSMRERRSAVAAAGSAERSVGSDRLATLVRTAVDRVDIGAVVDAIDINAVLDRIDLEALVNRLDLNVIIDHIDVQAVIERVDIAAVVERIDVDELISRTELGAIIAQSTSGMASRALDSVRSQTVGLDDFTDRWVNRVLRRRAVPEAPPQLMQPPPPEPTA